MFQYLTAIYVNNLKRSYICNIFLVMIYVSCVMICNPVFLEQINLFSPISLNLFELNISLLLYPIIYIINDLIIMLSSKKFAILAMLLGTLYNGIFAYISNYISNLPLPQKVSYSGLQNTYTINLMGKQLWLFYTQSLILTFIAAICQIMIFSYLYNRFNSFFLAFITSNTICLTIYNLKYKNNILHVINHNLNASLTIAFIYAMLVLGTKETMKMWKN